MISVGSRQRAPSPAVAPPAGGPRFPLLDSIRGSSVLVVIAFHVSGITGALGTRVVGSTLVSLGVVAIILFFVMSAFLLSRPFAAAHAAGRPPPSARRFFRRRALRVLPAYWVALTVLAIFPGIVGVFTGEWWRYFFFLQTYSPETYGRGIPPAWTLCVEVVFYLLLPVWAAVVRRLPAGTGPNAWLRAELGGLAVVFFFGIAVQVAARRLDASHEVGESILGQSPWFALGMALAAISVAIQRAEGPPRPRVVRALDARPGLFWLAAIVPFLALARLQHVEGGILGIVAGLRTPQPAVKTIAIALLSTVVALLVVAPAIFGDQSRGLARRAVAIAPLAWLGLVSYAFYLYHLTVAQILGVREDPAHFSATGLGLAEKLPNLETPILFGLTVAVSAGLAALSYYVVELPFLRRKDR